MRGEEREREREREMVDISIQFCHVYGHIILHFHAQLEVRYALLQVDYPNLHETTHVSH